MNKFHEIKSETQALKRWQRSRRVFLSGSGQLLAGSLPPRAVLALPQLWKNLDLTDAACMWHRLCLWIPARMNEAAQDCWCVPASWYCLSLGVGDGTGELTCFEIRTSMHILPHSCEVRGPSSLLQGSDVGLGREAPTTNVPHPPSPPQRVGNNSRTWRKTRLPTGSQLLGSSLSSRPVQAEDRAVIRETDFSNSDRTPTLVCFHRTLPI